MSLLDDARRATRTVTTEMDDELLGHIAAALSDMRRVGVREELLTPPDLEPMAHEAVLLYVKAHYGYDNPEAQRFLDSYKQTVTDLVNSSHNECANEDPRAAYSMSIRSLLEA